VRSRQKALLIAGLAKTNKAEDIVILDMKKLSSITDFFVIATASSTRRAQTIITDIEETLAKEKEVVSSIEGYQVGGWMLIDAYDVVTHVFDKDVRNFYNLEGLWSDAPRVRLCRNKRKRRLKRTSKGK